MWSGRKHGGLRLKQWHRHYQCYFLYIRWWNDSPVIRFFNLPTTNDG